MESAKEDLMDMFIVHSIEEIQVWKFSLATKRANIKTVHNKKQTHPCSSFFY